MVPLAQIAHNRAWRAELLTSNTLGQNTRALEACDTVYQRFWVTNAEAMNDYADTTVPLGSLSDRDEHVCGQLYSAHLLFA
ncbi:hypothetical protein ABH37_13750 [Mycobacterium haemophilum]|uniref:PPE domain-containing protein n=1 Tax=Mycobacterium haemophilum TaxID=29311 RepID=A0A0I9YMB6_9MYCO|nr:hypothetical protein ABH39_12610 [Mycobacterium haemophilum]KLO35782.1 hypothetical protein ABH38_14450 [Mycobacterium haemophilum]KLO41302.1 hypothetical protein ABH37_13750 [Mycobacterium haemophilum]KLO49183.1 hypothetical protein ABH36_13555 [Mycobacterium haemophilum]